MILLGEQFLALFGVGRFFATLVLYLRVSHLVTTNNDLFTLLSLASPVCGRLAFTAADLGGGSFA